MARGGLRKKAESVGMTISDNNLALSMCRHFPGIAAESLLLSHDLEEVKKRTIKRSVYKALELGYVVRTKDPSLFTKTELGSVHL